MTSSTKGRLLAAAAGACTAALLSGCGVGLSAGASPTAAPPATQTPAAGPSVTGPSVTVPTVTVPTVTVPTVTVPTVSGGASSGAAPTAAGSLAPLPAKFPLPDGAKVASSVQDQNELAAQITLPDTAAAYDFWRSALPEAGYQVTKAESIGGGLAEIRFRGHGCVGNSQLALTGGTAQLECDQS